jgi:integrase
MLSEAIEEYLLLRARQKAANTVKGDSSTTRRFLAFTGNIQTKNLTANHVEDFFYREGGEADRLSPASFNTVRALLQSFLKFAERRKYIGRDLLQNVDSKKKEKRDRLRLSPHELMTMLDMAKNPRDRAILALLINTAGRSGEITNLRVKDLDLENGWLDLYARKSLIHDKRPISTDLDQEMRRWLRHYQDECGPLDPEWYLTPGMVGYFEHGFFGKDQYATNDYIWRLRPTVKPARPERIVNEILRRMGYETLGEGGHTIRRSVARAYFEALREEGYDGALQSTKALLNHASCTTTELYLGLTMERSKRDMSIRGKPFMSALVDKSNVTNLYDASITEMYQRKAQ